MQFEPYSPGTTDARVPEDEATAISAVLAALDDGMASDSEERANLYCLIRAAIGSEDEAGEFVVRLHGLSEDREKISAPVFCGPADSERPEIMRRVIERLFKAGRILAANQRWEYWEEGGRSGEMTVRRQYHRWHEIAAVLAAVYLPPRHLPLPPEEEWLRVEVPEEFVLTLREAAAEMAWVWGGEPRWSEAWSTDERMDDASARCMDASQAILAQVELEGGEGPRVIHWPPVRAVGEALLNVIEENEQEHAGWTDAKQRDGMRLLLDRYSDLARQLEDGGVM